MSNEEVVEQDIQEAVSESSEVEPTEGQQESQTMVPLAALMATKKKLREAEAEAKAYREMARERQQQAEPEEQDDPNALVEKHVLKEMNAATKREILEAVYQDNNPEAVRRINKYLGLILERKPWLADTIPSALNRYARANEIVEDYLHLVEEKPLARKSGNAEAQRIVQNSQKPRSPAEIGKSARPEGMEYLKSIQGKKEFREYRQKVLQGEA